MTEAVREGEIVTSRDTAAQTRAVQVEFIRLIAQKYGRIAFGDTDHSDIHIDTFFYSDAVMMALIRGGIQNIFIEVPQRHQKHFNALRASAPGVLSHDAKTAVEKMARNSWLCAEGQKELSQIYARAVQKNKSLNFICADMRSSTPGKRRKIRKAFKILGRIQDGSQSLDERTEKYFHEFLKNSTDDRATVEFIGNFSAPYAVFYGAAHFSGHKIINPAKCMGALLSKEKPLIVLNIRGTRERYNEGGIPPGAVLYVSAQYDCPHGVRIENPELQGLYDEAVYNIALRASRSTAPRSIPRPAIS